MLTRIGLYGHVCEYDDAAVPRLHAQRPGEHPRVADTDTAVPLPHDGVHALYGRPGRAGQDGAQDDGAGRDAPAAAAQEPHGVNRSRQEELLHLYPQRHPRRGRPHRRSQEFATHSRAQAGHFYPVGSGEHTGRPDEAQPVHPHEPPRERADAGEPHEHRYGKTTAVIRLVSRFQS